MGKRGPKPKGNVDTKWSKNLSYCIGLIATDGCLLNDGRHIDLTSADLQQVKNFKEGLGLSHIKIGKKKSGTVDIKKYHRVQFGDVLFYNWLNRIGITSNKSKTIGRLNIPDKYFMDFFRGCFDGDGSIYAFWDKRWKSSYTYWISITSASTDFLKWINSEVYKKCRIKGYICKNNRAQELRFSKRATNILYKAMYKDKRILFLDRKFAKLSKILSIDGK